MSSRWLGAAIACALAACGDNSDQCGPGTMNVANVCVPVATCGPGTKPDAMTGLCVPDNCGEGTVLNPITGTCEIDPSACKDGTVLVDGACQDPTATLVIDVEESPSEPNGYGVLEASEAPAGVIAGLKPIGGTGLVIHGHLAPFRDADGDMQLDPDADTYLVTVAAPTLIRVRGIGLGGAAAAFEVNGPGRFPYLYNRVGLSLVATSSDRELYLPSAGIYELTVADSRTIFADLAGGGASAPVTGEYFVIIDQLPLPTPTAMTVTSGHASASDMLPPDHTLFYTLPMGSGFNHVTLDVPSTQVDGALSVLHGSTLAALAYEVGSSPAATFVAGFDGAQQPLLVLEPVVDSALAPVPFTLDVLTSDAVALPADGSATAPVVEQRTTNVATVADMLATNQFYVDVTSAQQVVAFDLAWTHPISGEIYDDAAFLPIVQFTSTLTAGTTWSSYHGIVLLPHPGRYYFAVFDPAGIAGTTTLAVTSRIAPLAPTPIAISAPADVALDDTFHAGVFGYTNVGQPWQTFDASSTTSGGHTLAFYGQGEAVRADALATSAGTAPAAAPAFAHAFAQDGGAFGRIMLDELAHAFYILVRPTAPAAGQSVHGAFGTRVFVDLGLVVPNMLSSSTDHSIDASDSPTYVLLHTAVGNTETLTVHPHDPASLDTRFHRVAADESDGGPVVDTSPNGDDSEAAVQGASGWTAFVIDAVTPPTSAQAFDVTATAVAP